MLFSHSGFFLLISCLFTALLIASPHLLVLEDPTLTAGLFEGDIAGVDTKNKELVNVGPWPNGVVPYKFGSGIGFLARRSVLKAIAEIERKTCVRFRLKAEADSDFLRFDVRRGCYSSLGDVGGQQEISMGSGCEDKGVALHEIMHALGFWHENSRVDRDDYILINWENIPLWFHKYFSAYTLPKSAMLGEKYDINSVTHMSSHAFAKDRNQPTLMAKDERRKIAQRFSLSEGDVRKIKRRYCGLAAVSEPVIIVEEDPEGSRRGPGRDPNDPCSDKLDKCNHWATQGHCYKRERFMRANCKESCLFCKTIPCKNYNSLCHLWSRMGNCKRQRIIEICPLACRICHKEDTGSLEPPNLPTVSTCEDYHFRCNEATQRDCLFNDIIKRLCPKTCKRCDLFIQPGRSRRGSASRRRQRMPVDLRNCVNHNTQCETWARRDRCRWQTVWKQCRKACGLCVKKPKQ